MLRRLLGALALAALALPIFACTGDAEPTESSQTTTESLKGGCRIVCPKCHPGEVCPMYACIQDCNGPPARCVETMLCPIGYAWDSKACSCLPTP
jgi:hypothetical protein